MRGLDHRLAQLERQLPAPKPPDAAEIDRVIKNTRQFELDLLEALAHRLGEETMWRHPAAQAVRYAVAARLSGESVILLRDPGQT